MRTDPYRPPREVPEAKNQSRQKSAQPKHPLAFLYQIFTWSVSASLGYWASLSVDVSPVGIHPKSLSFIILSFLFFFPEGLLAVPAFHFLHSGLTKAYGALAVAGIVNGAAAGICIRNALYLQQTLDIRVNTIAFVAIGAGLLASLSVYLLLQMSLATEPKKK